MKHTKLSLMLFLGIALGCAASYATRTDGVTAQVGPGQFRECVMYQLDAVRSRGRAASEAKSVVGWTPVGGWAAGVVLCR